MLKKKPTQPASTSSPVSDSPHLLPPSSSTSSSSQFPKSHSFNSIADHSRPKGGPPKPPTSEATKDNMTVDDFIEMAIQCHEHNELEESFRLLEKAAKAGSPLGLFLLGISVRHGWGCKQDQAQAFQYLKRSACSSFSQLNLNDKETLGSAVAKGELVLAIYEIGVCYSHGWGVTKHREAAAFYFRIAADLGYAEAQSELAFCYQHGHGVKKDAYKAAKYYRLAHAQGIEPVGNSWIFKEKYDKVV